jgi:diguanylate cyclase (GGDEF)-like protein/PAS domain S-box-containing protein
MSTASILVVDDNPTNLKVVVAQLEERGMHVLVAQDGEEALARAMLVHPDLILMDVMMPNMDGFETCKRIKAEQQIADIPVIFMSSLSDIRNKVVGFSLGGVDYVTKPFRTEELMARIDLHLELHALRRRLTTQNEELRRARDELESRVQARTAALQATMEQVRDLYNNAPCGYHSLDENGYYVEANDTLLNWLGYRREELVGVRRFTDNIPEDRHEQFERAFAELKRVGSIRDIEYEMVRKDGSTLPVLISATVARGADGRYVKSRATIYDISERKKAEAQIQYMAHHDSLTGLPNRLLFQDRLAQLIAHANRRRDRVGVIFLDLDQFKHINDSLGHHIGDRVLQEAGRRITGCLREGDSVARLGGDEFVVSLPELRQTNAAAVVAGKVLAAMREPFRVDGHEMHVGCSLGISIFPDDGQDVDTLMRAADTAMYHAKQKGRGTAEFFTPTLNAAVQHRLRLATQLRQALARDQLFLEYQPQVDLTSGNVYGCEALVRWRHPELGLVSPAEFITIAEEVGLIQSIGEWVLREACAQLKRWRDGGHGSLRIAVNLSVRQLQRSFVETAKGVLESVSLPADALELEITESLMMQSGDDTMRALHELTDLGIRLTMDDFGVGYSSLAYLHTFPLSTLKVDRSFVSRVDQSDNDCAIVGAIIAMATSLNLHVIAEGVETIEQEAFLKARGCNAAQGYLYSRPVPADQFERLVQSLQHPDAGMASGSVGGL